jgi:rhodanese-related sulfurtransferase
MPHMKMILLMVMAILVVVCGAILLRPSVLRAQGEPVAYANLSPAEAWDTIGKRSGDSDFVLLDVRTPKEFREERIEGAVMVDYLSPSFRDEVAKLDRGKSYLVYCRTGHRSLGAVDVMRELGFRNVLHLAGGITKWKEARLPATR